MNSLDYRPQNKTLSDVLPYHSIDETNNVLWLKDGSATNSFQISPMYTENFTDDDLFVLRNCLTQAINQLSEGMLVQFFVIREQTNQKSNEAYQYYLSSHQSLEGVRDAARLKLLAAKDKEIQEQKKKIDVLNNKLFQGADPAEVMKVLMAKMNGEAQ